jgi:hypothetical protein
MKLRWRFGLAAAFFLVIFSLYPQLKLWYVRGGEWQGNYAYNDIDEVAYAAYVKALIDGRPRINDPYTGRDDSAENPQPESLFSIQFVAPYTLAIPARLLGISTPWMMIVGGAVAAALTALAIFWFLFRFTGSNWYAMAGCLITLAGGAVFAGEGAMSEIFLDGFSYPYFPGFRRYIPALAMPAFFWLVAVIWRLLEKNEDSSAETGRSYGGTDVKVLLALVLAVFLFAYAVFSYFYIWTTAAAWLACLAGSVVTGRPRGYKTDLERLIAIAFGCVVVLIPYAYLLSRRSHSIDDVQLLVQTHSADLTRFPEYVSAAVLLILIAAGLLRRVEIRSRSTMFVLSLAAAVFIVFNQQIVSGQSLQPIHYQVFIGNYVAGLALVSAIGLIMRKRDWPYRPGAKLAFGTLAVIAVVWGFVECHYTVRVLDDANLARDEQIPLARRLSELAKDDPNPYKSVVLHLGLAEADDLPTFAPQATLWARHQHVFTTISMQENKERYYQYLYYQGVTETSLAGAMKHGDFVSMIALFGWGRHTDRLNPNFKPLTYREIDDEARNYAEYIRDFDPRSSPETIVSFLVVRTEDEPGLENFDRWYERDQGESYGPLTLYRVKLKG